MNKKIINFLKSLFIYPVALILLFEEWGWEPLAKIFEKIAKLPLLKTLENKIVRLPPSIVLFVFGLPFIALLPIKFFAFYLLSTGHFLLGTFLIILAKILGTAICARLFQLTKPSLLKLAWFGRFYPKWKAWKDNLLSALRSSGVWILMSRAKRLLRKNWLRLYFNIK